MEFRINYEQSSQREAFRVAIPGIFIRLEDGTVCAARDISTYGAGFSRPPEHEFEQGQHLTLALLIANQVVLRNLEAVIVRATEHVVACRFDDLSVVQEECLDKIVLEIQKRLIIRHKTDVLQADTVQVGSHTEDAPHAVDVAHGTNAPK